MPAARRTALNRVGRFHLREEQRQRLLNFLGADRQPPEAVQMSSARQGGDPGGGEPERSGDADAEVPA